MSNFQVTPSAVGQANSGQNNRSQESGFNRAANDAKNNRCGTGPSKNGRSKGKGNGGVRTVGERAGGRKNGGGQCPFSGAENSNNQTSAPETNQSFTQVNISIGNSVVVSGAIGGGCAPDRGGRQSIRRAINQISNSLQSINNLLTQMSQNTAAGPRAGTVLNRVNSNLAGASRQLGGISQQPSNLAGNGIGQLVNNLQALVGQLSQIAGNRAQPFSGGGIAQTASPTQFNSPAYVSPFGASAGVGSAPLSQLTQILQQLVGVLSGQGDQGGQGGNDLGGEQVCPKGGMNGLGGRAGGGCPGMGDMAGQLGQVLQQLQNGQGQIGGNNATSQFLSAHGQDFGFNFGGNPSFGGKPHQPVLPGHTTPGNGGGKPNQPVHPGNTAPGTGGGTPVVDTPNTDGPTHDHPGVGPGEVGSPLARLTKPAYSDGVSSIGGADRPNPREISNNIAAQGDKDIPNNFGTSDMVWQWGQFVDHDISLTPSGDEVANIKVPKGDASFDPRGTGESEISFKRSKAETDKNGTRQQINEITALVDGSQVYGSDEERTAALRVGADSPYMKMSEGSMLPYNEDSIENENGPRQTDPTQMFVAGDVRANEQPGLAAMHTLFVREHNRVADEIMQQNPHLSPEEVFQSARRVVTATMQKITYDEFLPALIGKDALSNYDGYDSKADPSVLNEFSTGAFRLGHSMIGEKTLRVDEHGNEIDDGHLTLRNSFFGATNVMKEYEDLDPILRGLASQKHQALDSKIIDGLRNFLFGPPGSGGLDLASLNIQRGRDHGLGSYNDVREALGLERAHSFADITSDTELQAKLKDTYGHTDKVDLWVGGLSEDALAHEGSQVGETFRTILTKQFESLRDADPNWYENDGALSQLESDLVGESTLSDVIKRNSNVGDELQDNVFYVKH